jgi:hypothetical protein
MAFSGAAGDLDNDNNAEGPTNMEIFEYIRENLQFDQLISEFENIYGLPSWIHVSFYLNNNRMQVLKSKRINNKIVYLRYE